MPDSDLQAINSNYQRWLETRGSNLQGINPFNYYCVQHFLKSYPVDDAEIRTGLVDKSKDGGIDGFYFFANRKYVYEDPPLDGDSEYNINIVIFQIKEGSGFSPIEVQKHYFFTDDLLDMRRAESNYQDEYHIGLKRLMGIFKEQYKIIAGTMPQVSINFVYITKLDCELPRPASDVIAKSKRVEKIALRHFSHANFKYDFVNAAKMFSQVRIRKETNKTIKWASQAIEAPEGWIGLVKLQDYYEFIQDVGGDFNEEIVVENVRGFLQTTYVNEGIMRTLLNPSGSAEFWLLNNGITILSKNAQAAGYMQLTVVDPQIVNGLQSSRQIHKYFKSPHVQKDNRRLLVRVLRVDDSAMRDQIIRATNSQNTMSEEMLRATDPIHQKIEEVFERFGYFYDRRKGYYKDQGKPVAKIVSLREVLQGMLAVVLRRPDDARARPTDYLKNNSKYEEVFRDGVVNIKAYLTATLLIRRVDTYLAGNHADKKDHFRNVRFHIAMCVSCAQTESAHMPGPRIHKVNVDAISDELIKEYFKKVWAVYDKYRGQDENGDIAAKGAAMVKDIQSFLNRRIAARQRRKTAK